MDHWSTAVDKFLDFARAKPETTVALLAILAVTAISVAFAVAITLILKK